MRAVNLLPADASQRKSLRKEDPAVVVGSALGAVEPADHGAPARWWVWVCPTGDFAGRLHVAGYALEKHGLYAVCDTHGDTFLR